MNEKMGFEDWLHELDRLTHRKVGLKARELPSPDYRPAYDDGFTPEEVFELSIRAELEDLGFHLEIADIFDRAMKLGCGEIVSEHMAAEAGLDYVTTTAFDLEQEDEGLEDVPF